MGGNYSQEEKLGFREIVLNYLKKIMDLNLKIVSGSVGLSHVKCYRDSVLGLSDVLIPFYDSDLTKAYETYETDYNSLLEKCSSNGLINNQAIFINGCKKHTRKLFRELNLLLSRNDYLKSEVFGEGKSEELVEEEEE